MSIAAALCVAHLELFVIGFFTSFHVCCGVIGPFGVTRCLYRLDGMRNVVIFDEALSSGIWFWHSSISIVAKHAAIAGMCGLLSSAKLFVPLLICLLSGDR